MSITLTVADNADGTGAVFTISGSDPASTNYLHTSTFDGELGPAGSWTSVGNRVGDGTIAVAAQVGYWFGIIINTLSSVDTVSPVVYFAVTSGNEAVHWACLLAAQTRIRLLDLSGIVSTSIVVKKLPIDRLLKRNIDPLPLPCILLTPLRQTMNPATGVTVKDDVIYPVLCSLVSSDNQEPTLEVDLDRQTLWIEIVAKAFRNQRLPGVSKIIITSVSPQEVVAPGLWKQNVMVSGLILKFVSRESRGLVL